MPQQPPGGICEHPPSTPTPWLAQLRVGFPTKPECVPEPPSEVGSVLPSGFVDHRSEVSVAGEAVRAKSAGEPWFCLGTLGLVLLNAGLAVFEDGVKSRAPLEFEVRRPNKS